MKKILIFTSCLFFLIGSLSAQEKTVSGKVTSSEDGSGLPGVTVLVEGTITGTATDLDGNYTINVPDGASLTFSFVGYIPQTIEVGTQTEINVTLEPDVFGLEEVVVTALGIQRKAKNLTYSTQKVDGNELTRAKDVNLINSLAGKSAGVSITKSSSGVGGSSKVTIRGNRSAFGNNQPLYVIDGIPMNNSSSVQSTTSIGGTNDAGNRDGGDGISNLNPDDIESINILKGASASALYGSQAANGVIVITTKKGKAGATNITFSSNTTFEKVMLLPELQDSYGMSTGGESWGTAITNAGHDPKDYFQTGVNKINSFSISSGQENYQTYFSYANTAAKGIVPGNELAKHNFNFRETAKVLNDKLSLDASVNLVNQKVNNRPIPGGYYFNPLVGLYRFPRGEDISTYETNFETYDASRNINTQNWVKPVDTWEQNPWWLTHRVPNEDIRNRVISSLTASIEINENLNVRFRGSADYTSDKFEQQIFASTTPALTADNDNGRYIQAEYETSLYYGDVILNFNKTINDLSIAATIGASINDVNVQSTLLDSKPDGLEIPNVFNLGNMLGLGYLIESKGGQQTQSIFGTATLGFKEFLFLDLTGRNDWSSTLAYTSSMSSGFFYPSAGLTYIFSETIDLPDAISFGKIRASYSKVGNTIPPYLSNRTHIVSAGGSLIFNSEAPFSELKPEMSTSLEFGAEMRFLDNKLSFDFTYYKTNTENQFFRLPAAAGSGYSWYYVNSGDIENKGIELVLGIHPVTQGDFKWKNYINFATNKNTVVELHPDLEFFNFGNQTSSSYWMRMEEGGEYGDIYGVAFERDAAGNVQVDVNGLPIRASEFEKIANVNPDFTLGWNSGLSYKNFDLNFLIDGRFGGEVIDMTGADLDLFGVSQNTADARAAGSVNYGGQTFTDVEGFYSVVGGRDGVSEYYVYDATNIRLRELSVAYNIPIELLGTQEVLKGATVSLIGRNLFFLKNEAPYDPDAVMSTQNDLQGVDVFGLPSTKSLGFNIKLSF